MLTNLRHNAIGNVLLCKDIRACGVMVHHKIAHVEPHCCIALLVNIARCRLLVKLSVFLALVCIPLPQAIVTVPICAVRLRFPVIEPFNTIAYLAFKGLACQGMVLCYNLRCYHISPISRMLGIHNVTYLYGMHFCHPKVVKYVSALQMKVVGSLSICPLNLQSLYLYCSRCLLSLCRFIAGGWSAMSTTIMYDNGLPLCCPFTSISPMSNRGDGLACIICQFRCKVKKILVCRLG